MLCRSLSSCTCRIVVVLLGIGLLPLVCPEPAARGQLQTLSAGNADQQWREAQLQAFDQQLADAKLPDALKRELKAQRGWLAAWDPKARNSSVTSNSKESAAESIDSPADELAAPAENTKDAKNNKETAQPDKDAKGEAKVSDVKDSDAKQAKQPEPLKEPIVDPDDRAEDLRSRLFDPKRPATAADTKALQTALSENSGDVGLRQLQLHWLDQPTYRDAHWQEITHAADRVLALLGDLPATEETKAAAAYANYRKARALAHALRGRPLRSGKIAGLDKLADAEREQMQNAIGECWRQIETLVGAGHPEFFQLEVYNLRRYGWSGQALEILERHSSAVDEVAYLGERQSILESLGWTTPAEQTAAILTRAKKASSDGEPKRVFEIQYLPLPQSTAK